MPHKLNKQIKDIEIIVKTSYSVVQSNPSINEFFFVYNIDIVNHSENIVQLLSRKWWIKDGIGESRFVEGDGVVGEQPIIEPGNSHNYFSGCLLKSIYGNMKGTYTFLNLKTKQVFDVDIKEFNFISPWAKN